MGSAAVTVTEHVCDPADVAEAEIWRTRGWEPATGSDAVYVQSDFDPIRIYGPDGDVCPTCGVVIR